ncbi:plasma-membrane choline transporter-domain-containing protein [Mycotypha africana]|uniref:plasma-membrane choline transporter-domain-containing protein n=1 Tax=Mycotypha africana TaxID=64632 RepID=UPI002300898A|nr:plasma-membrane choline transporter-domain-containing protein [Mycotypha africana]KAI8971865.1 plasma-membrane choline transporter-domain-containing protein [Mycotypha africana]
MDTYHNSYSQQQYSPPPIQQQYPPPPQQYASPPQDYTTMQPPQYYATPTAQPPIAAGYNTNAGYSELGEHPINANDKIRPSSGFKDIWATILWICNMVAFIALSVVGLRSFSLNKGSYGGMPAQHGGITLDSDTVKIFGYSAIIAFGFSFLYLILANIFPGPLITITFIGSIIVYLGVTIYYFYMHYYSAAIIFLIFTLLYAFCFWSWRDRIPFATVMLRTITSITRKYWSTIVTGIVSLVVQTVYSIWFMITVVGIYQVYYNNTGSNSKLNAAMVFLIFSFYWTTQVISYVTHVTLSGVFATVYFLNNQIAHPIWGSAKRALTTSFGSICFGGLLIALINTLRYFIQVARSNTDNEVFAFMLCILDCIIGCYQGLFEWFNQYAFSGVAIYGQAFIPSAKRTWALIQDRGVEALINDNLIGNVLAMGTLLVGVLSSLLGYLYLLIAKPAYNATGNMTPIVMLICFVMGMSMFSVITTVISSGVTTTFVCLAEDPDALRRVNPQLFETIRQTWPQVVQGI